MSYVPPAGDEIGLEFGESGYAPPLGDRVALEFVRDGPPPAEAQYLFPAAIESPGAGVPSVRNNWQFARPSGFSAIAVGTPERVWRYHWFVRPSGFNSARYGTAQAVNLHRFVYPAGFLPQAFGTPSIINRNRYVTAGGIAPPSLSTAARVWLYTRFLRPGGILGAAFGTTRVSHQRQHVTIGAGLAPPPLGTAWISYGLRPLAPVGFTRTAVGIPAMGFPRVIAPMGWDSARFGSRIVPESQEIAPPGYRADDWGQATVWNYRTLVSVPGFRTTHEEFRWGRAHVWNLLQIIVQTNQPNDGTYPPPIQGWTTIYNRDRVVTVYGVQPPVAGSPLVENTARVLAPTGINAFTAPLAGMIGHAIRPLQVDGIEPPLVSHWVAVYNAARLVPTVGSRMDVFGEPEVVNTTRTLTRVGNVDLAEPGEPFVAFRVREILMEPRWTIAPPVIELPEVKLQRMFVDPIGSEMDRFGVAYLFIHWNVIAPKWAHRDYAGYPEVRNLTPELRTWGRASDEYGDAFVRLQWRPVATDGANMQQFGRPRVADRRQFVTMTGTNYLRIGDKLVVTKTGAPPYTTQLVIVEDPASRGARFGQPSTNERRIQPGGISPPSLPTPRTFYMGIHVDAGIREEYWGNALLTLKNRTVEVTGEASTGIVVGRPRISPHTIWAVKEAPSQAIVNHPTSNALHYVGETFGNPSYKPGERFGTAIVRKPFEGVYANSTFDNMARYGTPRVSLRYRYIEPVGFRPTLVGWATVGDGTQDVRQFASGSFATFGRPVLSRPPYVGPQTVRPSSFPALAFGTVWASLFIRELPATGWDSMQMGTRRTSDTPYMWQGLRIGPLMPTIPNGFDVSRVGTPWVSLRVRELVVPGVDAFLEGYDVDNFAGRMRVHSAGDWPPSAPIGVWAVGLDYRGVGAPNVRNAVHYIRPDGNADQFRKGAP